MVVKVMGGESGGVEGEGEGGGYLSGGEGEGNGWGDWC